MTDKEKQAWEAYVDARLEAAEQSEEVSHEEALELISSFVKELTYVSREMA